MRVLLEVTQEVEDQYKASLRDYLTRVDEEPLFQAYELGRKAIASGLGVLEISGIHQRVLISLLPGLPSPIDIETMLQRSLDLFHEILSPFEIAHRGFLEMRAKDEELPKSLQAEKRLNAELERRIHHRTEQLQDVTKELEMFGYSIAHDLRAPLRAIDGFTRALAEDHAGRLDDEGKRLLTIIRSSTRRMGELIDGIHAFSRISGKEIEALSTINMKECAQETVHELLKCESNHPMNVRICDLPSITGNAAMLRQVFRHLIANAITFSRCRSEPIIEIGSDAREDEYIFYVRDNGVGFDMRHAKKLFGVFQRLHSTDNHEGTGVGLAIVQRIIHLHGGRVWAEGEVDKGATFYFTLPKKKNLL